jgi:hypothetical protein
MKRGGGEDRNIDINIKKKRGLKLIPYLGIDLFSRFYFYAAIGK